MSRIPSRRSDIVLYQTEDGQTRIQCRLENETIWLTQALIAELFQVSVPTVNEHLKGIYTENELEPAATIRKFRIVRLEGAREVTREIEHYNLDAILTVGFRDRSHRGTRFRQWARSRWREYLVKGFTMDDERLKRHRDDHRQTAAEVFAERADAAKPLMGLQRRPGGGVCKQGLMLDLPTGKT